MATHSSILAWEIPWTEEPGRLQSLGLQTSETQLSNRTEQQHIGYRDPDKHVLCVSLPLIDYKVDVVGNLLLLFFLFF